MASTSFNATKDQIGAYVARAAASDGAIGVLLLQAVESRSLLADRDTISDLLAAANDEADFTNYTRKTLATPTRTVDDTNDRVLLGGAVVGTQLQITWADAGGTANNTLTQVVFYYEPETTPTEANRLPLMATDISASTDGNDLVLTLHADGFARVVSPAA